MKNLENIMKELKFEILKPHHDTRKFQSENKQLEKYLQKDALDEQKCEDKVTHLVIWENEIIGYFSLQVYLQGIPIEDYNIISNTLPEIPSIDRLPLVEIKRFCMAEGYEHFKLVENIFDNIIYNIKNIFRNADFDGVSISITPECNIQLDR